MLVLFCYLHHRSTSLVVVSKSKNVLLSPLLPLRKIYEFILNIVEVQISNEKFPFSYEHALNEINLIDLIGSRVRSFPFGRINLIVSIMCIDYCLSSCWLTASNSRSVQCSMFACLCIRGSVHPAVCTLQPTHEHQAYKNLRYLIGMQS